MKALRARIPALFMLVFTLLCSDRAWAQAPLEPAQMPARTIFYVIWRGTPAGDARKSNSLLALWDDPDLAPMRAAALQNLQGSSAKDPSKPQLSREEIELCHKHTQSYMEMFGYSLSAGPASAPSPMREKQVAAGS